MFLSAAQKFLNSSMLMSFSASDIFCFTSSTSAKHFHLRTFSHPGKQTNKQKLLGARLGKVGHWGFVIFGQKLLKLSEVWAGAHKSLLMKWANTLKKSSKKFHWSRTQPLTTPPAETLTVVGS